MGLFDVFKREKTLSEKVSGWMRGDFSNKKFDAGLAVTKTVGAGVDAARTALEAKQAVDGVGDVLKTVATTQRW